MADALKSFLLHPLAIIAHVLCQTLCPAPSLRHLARSGIRVYGSHSGKPRRNLNHGLVDHHSHRVQVMGVGLQPQALGLQGDGSAAGEGVQQLRGIAAGGFQNFRFSRLQHLLVVGVLPHYQVFQNTEQPLPFSILFFLRGELLRVGGRVIHQTRPNDSTSRRQRPPRPPQMQGGRVPVADGLFPRRFHVNFFQRQCYLYKFLCCHLYLLTADTESRTLQSAPVYHSSHWSL